MRRYYLHTRKNIFYAELIDSETGGRLTARSTGTTVRDEALMVVHGWLRDGFTRPKQAKTRPVSEVFTVQRILDGLKTVENLSQTDTQRILDVLKARGVLVSATIAGSAGSELFSDFLLRFWDFEHSPYVKEKMAHGQRLGEQHCRHSLGKVKKDWLPFFAGKRLAEVTRDDIKRFSLDLSKPERNLSPATRNRILVAGTTPLLWAFSNGLIQTDVTVGIMRFSGEAEKRGILSPDEARNLFAMRWDDERLFLANLTGAVTGMRAGEIVALRVEDIGETCLHVRHSYLEGSGLKTPKNGQTRRVPIMPEVRDRLLSLAGLNPHGNGFIFWEQYRPKTPMDGRQFALQLREQLTTMTAGPEATGQERAKAEEYWKERNVLFHSWRHFYSARMADTMEASKIMRATGHKTKSVFDGYADHALEKDLLEIGEASANTFGNIIPFRNVI